MAVSRTRKTIRILLAGFVAASAATCWVARKPLSNFIQGNEINEFDTRKLADMLQKRVPANKIKPLPVEIIAEQIGKDEFACALRSKDGKTLDPLLVPPSDTRIKFMREAYALARGLPGFSNNGPHALPAEAWCQTLEPPSDDTTKPFGALQARYQRNGFYSMNYKVKTAERAALNFYHERIHHLFNLARLDLPPYRLRGDAAYETVIDEANAETSEMLAAYVAKLRGDDRFWKAYDRPRQKNYLESASGLYNAAGLAEYAKKNNVLPPLLNRLAFTYVLQDLVNFDSVNLIAKSTFDANADVPDGLGLDDNYIRQTMGKLDPASFGNAIGLSVYAWRSMPIGYTNYDEAVKGLKAASPENDYRAMIDVINTLTDLDNKKASYDQLNEAVMGQFEKLKKAKKLDFVFALNDIREVARLRLPFMAASANGFSREEAGLRRAVMGNLDNAIARQINTLCGATRPLYMAGPGAGPVSSPVNVCN